MLASVNWFSLPKPAHRGAGHFLLRQSLDVLRRHPVVLRRGVDVLGGHSDVLRRHLDVLRHHPDVLVQRVDVLGHRIVHVQMPAEHVQVPAEENFPAVVSNYRKGVSHFATPEVTGWCRSRCERPASQREAIHQPQRGCIIQPRVATQSLPWNQAQNVINPEGVPAMALVTRRRTHVDGRTA